MGAADIVHGHSSHHPKAVEIYQHKPIIYGCGDFLNDYEGIGGYEEYRPWFSLMYFVTLNLQSGYVESLEIVPLCVRRMTLEHAKDEGRRWLVKKLNTLGKEFSTQFTLINDRLVLAEPSLC
jgi:poly-gamma-glutamate synthesis protein (capsule biosynthesis protein)